MGWRLRVVVDGSGCGEVVDGGTVLGAWLKRSERGQSGLSAVARWWWERRHSGGGEKRRRKKGCSTVGGGRPL
jgi:hypothetical protein